MVPTSVARDGPLAVLTTRVRLEERMLFAALERRNIPYEAVDERRLHTCLQEPAPVRYRGVLNRIMSQTRSGYAARLFEASGHRVFNSSRVIEMCGDKVRTSLALERAGVRTPRTTVALTPDAALRAVESMGYPVVSKPVVGSWGRLVSRINDRDAAEALIEHRQSMRSPHYQVFYLQEYVRKPGRDIRAVVVGDRVVAAVYRRSEHWITNTARGARTEPCALTPELVEQALAAAEAVGGGMLAVDLMERPTGELLVVEVNHTMEFHGLAQATEVDLADVLVEHVQEVLAR